MSTIREHVGRLWDWVQSGPAVTRAHFTMKDGPLMPFRDGQHYFQVIVSEMFLAREREWFVTYAPVAFVAATYQYGKNKGETSPAIIGPAMFAQYHQEVPQGALIRNAPATGLHPYQGSSFTLTVVLGKIQQKNNVDKVLSVLEGFANIANPAKPAIAFASYLKVADGIVEGFRTLMDIPQSAPVLAHRLTINAEVGQPFEPGYVVLLDADERDVERSDFSIHKDEPYTRLFYRGEPYRKTDFILLEIAQGTKREDEETLPFYPLWEKALQRAMQSGSGNEELWKEAKAHYNSLKYEMRFSPDLTRPDYERLKKQFLDELRSARQEAVEEGFLGARDGEEEEDLPVLTDAEQVEMRAIEEELDLLDAENL